MSWVTCCINVLVDTAAKPAYIACVVGGTHKQGKEQISALISAQLHSDPRGSGCDAVYTCYRLTAVQEPVAKHRHAPQLDAQQLVLRLPVVRVVVTKYRASCQGIRSTK